MSLAAKLARLALAAALLIAQQSALAHGAWHLAGAGAVQNSGQGEAQLCDQHAALGTVAGALSNADTPQQAALAIDCAVHGAAHACAPAPDVAPSSRDPPPLL